MIVGLNGYFVDIFKQIPVLVHNNLSLLTVAYFIHPFYKMMLKRQITLKDMESVVGFFDVLHNILILTTCLTLLLCGPMAQRLLATVTKGLILRTDIKNFLKAGSVIVMAFN